MHKRSPKSFGSGKLIDTWVYDVESVFEEEAVVDPDDPEAPPQKQTVILKKIEMEVRMEKAGEDSAAPPYPIKDVKFVVTCNDPKFRIEGTDIEEIRGAAYSRVAEHFEIKWEKYYLVEVDHQRPWSSADGTGFIFSYREVYRGVTLDNKVLKREMKRLYGQYDWEITTWPGRFTTKGGKVIACIPANDANSDALEQFGKRIDTLRELIEDALRPEAIEETLSNLAKSHLLPPVSEKVKDAPEKDAKEEDEDAIDV
jgi:hypothetical protein